MQITSSVVLVADDDQSICELVSAILKPEGFTVLTANSGEQALQVFSERIVDIIFTDIMMEGISGLELLTRVTNMDQTVKVIVMTGHGGYDMVLKSLQAGAYDYIEKPLNDHNRITSVARKAYEYVMLARDNETLLAKLKSSHAKLATANSRLVALNKQLKKLAVTDSLTNLYNRRFMDLAMKREFERYCRYKDPFTLLMIDIDHFKSFNDNCGHESGDKALVHVAELIKENARTTDVVGRYGGEEFVMLLTKTPPNNACIVAERVRKAVETSQFKINGELQSLTISVGVAGLDGSESLENVRDLLVRTDEAMYHAKHLGRNQVFEYCSEHLPDMQQAANQ